MKLLEDAHGILADTELALRELIQHALAADQYSELARIARIADGVAHLRHRDAEDVSQVTQTEAHQGSGKAPQGGERVTPRLAPKSRGGDRQRATKFPGFERDGDKLIKIGWSKRDGRVYEHRAPHEVVALVGTAISTRGRLNELFTMEQVLPLRKKDGTEVPSYQAYLVLAWLRSLEVVERKGKEGYALTDVALDNTMLRRLWDSILER